MNKYKNLLKNIILFSLSSFIPKVISFFLLPMYTSYLTTYEYGVSDLINTTVSLFIPILTLNITDAVLRFSLDKEYDTKDIFSISMKIIIIDILIITIFILINLMFSFIKINTMYIIFFALFFITNSIYNVFAAFCKGIDKVKTIVVASIVNSITTLVFNILFIAIMHQGLFGYLLANTLGTTIAIITYIINGKLYKFFYIKTSKITQKAMIKYSFPMVFSAIAWWCNTASDRYIVSWISGVSDSGTYAAASKIPTILTTFQSIFMQAWSISAIKEFDKEDKDGFIGNIYIALLFLLSIICSALIIVNPFLSKILFSNDFYYAWKYVPPLLLSVTVDGLALFIGNLFYAVKDTKSRSITTIVGAVINIILNIILISKFGTYGAAISTLIGYFCGYIISMILIKKYIKIKMNELKNYTLLFLLLIQVVLAYFENKFIIIQIFIFMIIILLFKKDLASIIQVLKKVIGRKFKTKGEEK